MVQWKTRRELGFSGVKLKMKTGLECTTTTSPYYIVHEHAARVRVAITALYSMSQIHDKVHYSTALRSRSV